MTRPVDAMKSDMKNCLRGSSCVSACSCCSVALNITPAMNAPSSVDSPWAQRGHALRMRVAGMLSKLRPSL